LHQEEFSAEPSAKAALKRGIVDERLRAVFAQGKCALGPETFIETTSPRRWKLTDGNNVYLIKDEGDRLAVIRETLPGLCRVIEFLAFKAKPRYYTLRWRVRQMCSQCNWTVKKRWREKPQRLLVNIGAGSWYVRDWRILEYRGPWYNFYAPGFIDYGHDLTSNNPFPFADHSVHLFYCEHVIEHLKDEWCEHLFREVFRSLERGGGFRLVMPDADLIYDRLLKRDTEFFKSWMDRDNSSLEEAFCTLVAQSRHLDKTEFDRRLSTMAKHDFLDWCKEGLEYDWTRAGEHINWFDYEKLSGMLQAVGFRNVRRNEAQESQFQEARGRRFDTRPSYSLHIDCIKG
jgi:hypothetical protein